MTNKTILETFYKAFTEGDAATMTSYYHDEVTFTDPVFGSLKGEEAKAMWHMLIERGKGANKVTYTGIEATDTTGSAKWRASYPYGLKKRPVINHVQASFTFKDGKILTHTDNFNLYKWSKQALGAPGFLLGWTGFMRNKIQQQTGSLLKDYMKK